MAFASRSQVNSGVLSQLVTDQLADAGRNEGDVKARKMPATTRAVGYSESAQSCAAAVLGQEDFQRGVADRRDDWSA